MRIWSLVSLLVGSAVIVLGCGEAEAPPDPIVRPIKILELDRSSSEQILEFPGTVLAGLRAELGFEVPGRIVELPSTEGQIVIEGALLARLDPSDFRSKLDAELAKANAAKAEFDRMQKLFDERVASEQQLETRIRNTR